MNIYAIAQRKGGTGKTTVAHNLAGYLSRGRKKVLLVDLDGQGNLTFLLGANKSLVTSADVLTGQATAAEAITNTAGGFIIPGSPALATVNLSGKETGRLQNQLAGLPFDYCIIDCPPALSAVTIAGLLAADEIVVPSQADIFSIQGVQDLFGIVKEIKAVKPALAVAGILITRYNSRQIIARETTALLEQLAAANGTMVFKTRLREYSAVKEAQANCKTIYEYAPGSNASEDFTNFSKELIRRK